MGEDTGEDKKERPERKLSSEDIGEETFLNVPACPFRRVSFGATLCTISTDAYFAEVDPLTCLNCEVPSIISKPRCRFLSLGTELKSYRGEGKLVTAMACKALGIRLYHLSTCDRCGLYSEVPSLVDEIKLNKEKAEIKLSITNELIKEIAKVIAEEKEFPVADPEGKPQFCLRCWRFADGVCRKTPLHTKGKVTIVLPHSSRNDEIYKRAILPAIKDLGLHPYRIADEMDNIDSLCRACENIQEGDFLIVSLDDWDSNILFLLGLANGMGRRMAILKRDNVQAVPLLDTLSESVVEYDSISEIIFLLKHRFSPFVKRSQERGV